MTSKEKSKRISRVAVIGAGTTGAGIAAHLANAGVSVLLLDLPGLAAQSIERLRDADTIPLMEPENADKIDIGDVTDDADFAQLADCDWICEAIVERLDAVFTAFQ